MTKKFVCKGVTDDTADSDIYTDEQLDAFLSVIEEAMRGCEEIKTHKGLFKLADFEAAAECDLGYFTLTLGKIIRKGEENWIGTFMHGARRVTITAALE